MPPETPNGADNPARMTLVQIAQALRAGAITSLGLTEALFRRADELDPLVGAYITRFDDSARAVAALMDEELARGIDRGPLHGVPIGIKDILLTAEAGTTANSTTLGPGWGQGRDSTVARLLKSAGAVITGKLTTMEFAIGLSDDNKPFAKPRNPWDLGAWPGGSSSGSALGVISGLFPAAIGTDTAASIRVPAAFCGATGLKPTFGRVSKQGCIPFGHSLDHVGPLASTAEDCAAVMQVISGYDKDDSDSSNEPVPDFLAEISRPIEGLRVGVARDLVGRDPDVNNAFDRALRTLQGVGAQLVDIELPLNGEVLAAATMTMAAEAFAYHRNALRNNWGEYSVGTRDFLASGVLVTGADYVQAQRVRRAAQRDDLTYRLGSRSGDESRPD